MSFIDRVTGRTVAELPSAILFGQWSFDQSIGEGSKFPTGCQIAEGDMLTPGINEKSVFPQSDDTIHSRFFTGALPDEQNVEALTHFGQMLLDSETIREGWRKWETISPIAPGLDEVVKAHPLEGHIKNELQHLEQVCKKPHTHIRVENERVPVSRARRIAPKAFIRLASHTEDWEYRKLTSVQPRRILSEVREERWDLYENRVAVQLVTNLNEWLHHRIAKVRRVHDDIFARMAEFEVFSADAHYGRTRRICQLWGESWSASQSQETAGERLKQLKLLLHKVQGLMDSQLYRHISKRTQVAPVLQATNLLSNNVHYRGVSRLWNYWSRLTVSSTPSPHKLYIKHQELYRGFNAWCMLVIVRACAQLCLHPVKNNERKSEIRPGCVIQCCDGTCIEWEPTGTVVFRRDARLLLRFVPLVHSLEQAQSEEDAKARVFPLVNAVDDTTHWTVFLHPAQPGIPPYDALACIDNPPELQHSTAVDFIRVSPFSLESVERIARAIRWVTLAPRMLAYPPKLSSHSHDLLDIQAIRDGTVVRPLKPEEWSILKTRLKQSEKERDKLERQIRSSRKRKDKIQLQEAERCVQKLEKLKTDIDCAQDILISLATCPTCFKPAEFSAWDRNCFQATCRDCNSSWELRPNSESRIPVFLPSGITPNSDTWITDQESSKVWVDDVFGCDILAIPKRWGSDAVRSFLAPRTELIGDVLKKLLFGTGY